MIADPGFRPLVMLPQEHVVWLVDKSDDVLSTRQPQVDFFGLSFHIDFVGEDAKGLLRANTKRSMNSFHCQRSRPEEDILTSRLM